MAIGLGAAILGSAVIGGGASLLASQEQSSAAERSLAAQREGLDFQKKVHKQARKDLTPYRKVGAGALNRLSQTFLGSEASGIDAQTGEAQGGFAQQPDYSAFYESPGYQFRFDEGMRALDRSAAAEGGLRGGGHSRELQRYGQGLASQEFNQYANRLASLAGVGQSATGTGIQAGLQSAAGVRSGAAQVGQAYNTMGAARASGYAGLANAASGAAENYAFANALA